MMNSSETSPFISESIQPTQASIPGNRRNIHIFMHYGLAVVSITAGLLLRFALEAPVGTGLPTYVTFYPFVMLTALVGGFGPGLVATILTLLAVDIWIFPPVGQLTFYKIKPVELLGFALFGFMGLFISMVAEFYRRSRAKAAAYDRERALVEARKEKEFLAGLLQNAEQPFAMGYLDGRIILFNRAFETLTGYTAQELRNLNWFTQLTPLKWQDTEQHKLDELMSKGVPVRYEKEYIRKDGSRVPIELLTHIGRESESSKPYYYAFITDLTERKKIEAEKQDSNTKLQQHTANVQAINNELRESRMAALNLAEDADEARLQAEETSRELRITADQLAAANRDLESFSYSVSHDLRNPLSLINGFTNFLIEEYSDRLDEQGRDYLRRIDDGVNKMQSLINDMLSLSRIGRLEMKRADVDLSATVCNYLAELKSTEPSRNAECIIENNVHANADPQLIHLALENLLRNAWKFTAKKETARIEFGTMTVNKQVIYFIRDNGAGFDMQFAQKIFEPFKRVHAEKEFSGTGVGLSIVKRVVERHGGRVWAEGETGKGATFYFTLG